MANDKLWLGFTGAAYILGIATGILIVKNQMEQKYKKIAEEEIKSVKETFAKKRKKDSAKDERDTGRSKGELLPEYSNVIRENGYSGSETPDNSIRVIPPDEFGEIDEYKTASLTYLSDGIIIDESGYPVEDADVEDMIGNDTTHHFGEYEPDSVYVRNDKMKSDFEILRDERTWEEVQETMPPYM